MESARNITCQNIQNNQKCEVICSTDDNAVIIKKRISDLINIEVHKINLFAERWQRLNDNDFIDSNIKLIFYEVSQPITEKIVVQMMKNHFNIPKWIQVKTEATVLQLKKILSSFSESHLKTFLFTEAGEMLLDNTAIKSYDLMNASKLKVWRGNDLLVQLEICDPLAKDPSTQKRFPLEISVTESIINLKKKISEKISIGKEIKLALFTETSFLQDGKCLLDYPIPRENCQIYYADLIKEETANIKGPLAEGRYARIFEGEFGQFNERVAIKRYKIEERRVEDANILRYEIVTRIMLSKANVSRFAELMAMYDDSKYFYIVTDFMEQGSLKDIYTARQLNDHEIIRYSIQISEALDYMHSNRLIHRDLSCSSVLVGSDNNIKLSNFQLSEYLFTTAQLLEGIPGSKIESQQLWLAPEVLHKKPYGIKSDIWSFGVTVMEMLTRDRPYPNMNIVSGSHKICNNKCIEYNKNISPKISEFIDKCLHECQCERPTAKQCKQILEEFTRP